MNLNLRKPCANCPFMVDGALELRPGRLEEIVQGLSRDDGRNFYCHKTVHGPRGGQWIEQEDAFDDYQETGDESMCIGSAVFMLKLGRPSVSLRWALFSKLIEHADLAAFNDRVIEPDMLSL